MEPVDVKLSKYIEFSKENSMKDPKFEDRDYVKISTYQNIFAIVYAPRWSAEDWTYVFKDFNVEEKDQSKRV